MAQQKQISQQKYISQLELTTYLTRNTDLDLTLTELMTLICMSSFAPICTATQATLSARTRIKPTALKKAIAALKSKGMIVLTEPSQRNVSCKYAFNLKKLGFPAGTKLKYAPPIDIDAKLDAQNSVSPRRESARERKDTQLGLALADMGISKLTVGETAENSSFIEIFPELDIPQNSAKSSLPETQIQAENTPSFSGYELNSAST